MIDGRLLLPALGAWTGAVVVIAASASRDGADRHAWAGHVLLAQVPAVALLGVLLACVVLRRCRLGRRTQAGVLVVGALCLGAASGAIHVRALAPPQLSPWVTARATATVTGVIVSPPVVRVSRSPLPWTSASRLELRMATSQIEARGARVEVALPLVVRLPDGLLVPGVGSTVRVNGRLGPSPRDAFATLTVPGNAPTSLQVVGAPGVVDRVANAMRSGLQGSLRGTEPDAGALVAGLAIGDESGQSSELRAAMQSSGLSHLTAVSGGNVSVIVLAVLGVAIALRANLVVRALSALVALTFFVILVGPAPSVIRAAVMAGLVLVGLIVGGRRAGPSVLSASVLVLVIIAPGLVATWGFALSACATAGLILISGPVGAWLSRQPRLRRLPPAVLEGLAVTLSAQLATMPVLLAMGAPVGWVSVPANLMAMPVVAPITVLGLLAAVLAPVALPVATILSHLAAWPAAWIARVAFACISMPGSRMPWPEGVAGVLAFATLVVSALLTRWGIRRWYPSGVPRAVRAGGLALGAIVVVGWVLYPADRRSWPPAGWLMIMCDVGQGDGLLLNTAPGRAVVVDAGPDPDAIDRCLRDARISALPAVILTHFHADHVNGLSGVLRGREVATVLATPIRDPPAEAALVDRVLAARGIAIAPMSAGDVRTVDDVTWRAVWPRRRISSGSVPNNASVVLIVRTHEHNLLLMGDVEPEAQAALSTDISRVRFDVVKVPHHGSRYQHPMLTSWAPAPVALISVGADNDYGHPAASTISMWRAIGALVARTDEVGDVAIVEAASGIEVVPRHGMLQSS